VTANISNHWLIRALTGAGVSAAQDVPVAPGTAPAELWEAVTRVTGLKETDIATKAGERLRLGVADVEGRDVRAARLVPDRIARTHQVLPLRESDRQLVVATADPMDFETEQALAFASGRNITFELAGPRALERAIRVAYPADESLEALIGRIDDDVADAVRVVEDASPEEIAGREVQARPIVKLTNLILSEAIREEASDIHIEPTATAAVVRYRIDGVLRQYMQLPLGAMGRIISRVKVLAQMDIADRVRPQDGRARIQVGTREFDLRVSTVPASGTEKAVIRVLYPKTADRLDDLQLPAQETKMVRRLLSHRDGIVVVTGPTGSGKTTTLYAALRELATGKVNITTVEDPVEYELGGITQIQVEPKRGVTFASALRAILRQDPDVVLVGEIRDQETSQVALQAALTGHLVLATLHTNDAATAVTRLLDLGLDPKNVAAALRGALAQRLLRRVCVECARPVVELTDEEQRLAQQYGVKPVMRAIGCERCHNTGYRGRVAVLEVLTATPQVEDMVGASLPAADIRRAAIAAGMRPMVTVALEHVAAGTTTLQEVERVIGEAESSRAVVEMDERPHVLVVDDDEVVRDITAAALDAAGMRVTQAVDGVDALERLREATYEIVLLDLDMPRLDGISTLHRIRENLRTAALPVVILTKDRDAEIRVMDAGADDYLPKPVDAARLVSRLRAVLRRKGNT